ncbi:hypothetical protein B0H14DRAFT_2623404 [Mycena olivaceomarginata]|nr:hypothetical protein B0H14DRAFT_2623404 [Mycena olivaceomarginata]
MAASKSILLQFCKGFVAHTWAQNTVYGSGYDSVAEGPPLHSIPSLYPFDSGPSHKGGLSSEIFWSDFVLNTHQLKSKTIGIRLGSDGSAQLAHDSRHKLKAEKERKRLVSGGHPFDLGVHGSVAEVCTCALIKPINPRP